MEENLIQRITHAKTKLSTDTAASLEFAIDVYDFSKELQEKYEDITRAEAYHALIGSTYTKEQVIQEHPANKDISDFIKKYS